MNTRAFVTMVLLACGAMGLGCYRYHLLVPEPDPVVTACQRTVHALAWGLITHDTRTTHCERGTVPDSVTTACEQSNAIDQVRVTSNAGYALLTVLTLGFWSPMQLQWHCAKAVEQPGTIDLAPSDSGPTPVRVPIDSVTRPAETPPDSGSSP